MTTCLSGAPSRERSVFIDDAARLLGVSRRTVYYRIREGRLRTIRTAGGSQRVLLSSVEALLREGHLTSFLQELADLEAPRRTTSQT